MSAIKQQNIIFPTQKIKAKLHVEGLFAIPQQWKTTDQSNPGLFTYTVRMSKFQISKGKIFARDLTDREKRDQQDKSKKAGKKQSKNPQPNLEQQRLKKLEEQKQRQKQQLFSKLSQQDQFYYTCQDNYKSSSLKFQSNFMQYQFKGNHCLILEKRILQDKGDWLYIYKYPTVSQQQLAKMRKSKPKTLANINDLNPVVMRVWVGFQELTASIETKQIKGLRCKVQQVDRVADSPQPKLDKTYIKINFTLDQPVLSQSDQYTTSSLINDPEKLKQIPPEKKCLQELRQQLTLAVQSLAMQYSTLFWKEINMQEEQRNSLVFLNNKKGQTNKRKEQFLYDFNVTGKYKILKDRIKKCIVHICETKYKQFFSGMKTFNGVKCNNQDQIYSQIYNMLVTQYQTTLFKIIEQKQQDLGQVLVLNNSTLQVTTQRLLSTYMKETIVQRVKRTIREYEIIMDFSYGQKIIRRYILDNPQLIELKYQYGIYCIRNNLKPTKQVLPYIQEFLTKQKHNLTDEIKIQYMVILFNVGADNIVKGWVILREILEGLIGQVQTLSAQLLPKLLLLASLVLKFIQKSQLAAKYLSFALTTHKKLLKIQNKDENSKILSHKEKPQGSDVPSLSGIATYGTENSKNEIDNLYNSLILWLSSFSAFDLIKRVVKQRLSDTEPGNQPQQQQRLASYSQSVPEIKQLLVSHSAQSRSRLLSLSTSLYKSSIVQANLSQQKSLLLILIQTNFLRILNSSPFEQDLNEILIETQMHLKKCLTTNSDPQIRLLTLLRLGYVFCKKAEFGNARACLLKYLQMANNTHALISGLSYKLIGISCLYSNRLNQAIQSFKHWNLCDSKNRQVWLYLSLSYLKANQIVFVSQCLNQFQRRVKQDSRTPLQNSILDQIKQELKITNNQTNNYNSSLRQKILEAVAA